MISLYPPCAGTWIVNAWRPTEKGLLGTSQVPPSLPHPLSKERWVSFHGVTVLSGTREDAPMRIARSNMRFHPRELLPPNPKGIQVVDDHHQEPNHPKVRGRRRNAFSGRGDVVSGVTSAIFRTMALPGNPDKLLPQDPIQVERKGVRRRLGVLAENHRGAPASRRVHEIPDHPRETRIALAVVRQLQQRFVW